MEISHFWPLSAPGILTYVLDKKLMNMEEYIVNCHTHVLVCYKNGKKLIVKDGEVAEKYLAKECVGRRFKGRIIDIYA